MKRFYKIVSTQKTPNGWEIHLDSRPVKTPMRETFFAPNEAVANAVMAEWAAQEDVIDPETMPLTQIISTQNDRVKAQRAAMSAEVLKFLDTDLLCYRAPKDQPPGQMEKQAEIWNPWLDWFKREYGDRLETTCDLVALKHPQKAHQKVKDAVEHLTHAEFTVFQLCVPLAGSLILGLAFAKGAATADDIFNAARVEEHFKDAIYNAEKYGHDPLQEKKDLGMKRDLEAAEKYLQLLKS